MKKIIVIVVLINISLISMIACDTKPLSEILMQTTNATIEETTTSNSILTTDTSKTTSSIPQSTTTSSSCDKPLEPKALISPKNSCIKTIYNFEIQGTKSTDKYKIVISTNTSNWTENLLKIDGNCSNTNTKASIEINKAGTYYWKVLLANNCGETSYKVAPNSFIVGLENPIKKASNQCVGDIKANIEFLPTTGNMIESAKLEGIDAIITGDTAEADITSLSAGIHTWTIKRRNSYCSEIFTTTMGIVSSVSDPSNLSFANSVCKNSPANFSWTNETSHEYDIYYSDNSNNDLTGTLVESANITGSLSSPPSIGTAGTYYWKIIAKVGTCQSNIIISSAFTVKDFTDATNLIPSGNICTGNTVNVTWLNTPLHLYDVYYSTNNTADLSGTLAEADVSGTTLSSAKTINTAGTYYWKVRAEKDSCNGNVIVSSPFTVSASPVAPTSLTVPSDNCINQTYSFSWDNEQSFGTYQIQISTDNGSWSSPITGTILTNSTAQATITTAGTYWWRIRHQTTSCGNSTWIESGSSFTVNAIADANPSGQPANGSSPYNPSVSWTGSGSSYTIEISDNTGSFTSTSASVTTTGNSTTFSSANLTAGTYTWRVKANNTCNDGWHTETGTFTVESSGNLEFEENYINGSGGITGINNAKAIDISSDGKHAYVVGYSDNSVSVFSINASDGKLTFVENKTDGTGGVDGLQGAYDVIVSSDGKSVYVVGKDEHSLAVFSRNATTGELTYVDKEVQGGDGVTKMNTPTGVGISNDNKNVYVAADGGKALNAFTRNTTTGQLTYLNDVKITNDMKGHLSVFVSPDDKNIYVSSQTAGNIVVFTRNTTTGDITHLETIKDDTGSITKLGGSTDVIVSPDNKHVYATSYDEDAVVVFSRNLSTGALTFIQEITRSDISNNGLDGANAIHITSDGKNVYITSQIDDTITIFTRNSSTGNLTYLNKMKNNQGGVSGMDQPSDVIVSPNDAHVYVTAYDSSGIVLFNRI